MSTRKRFHRIRVVSSDDDSINKIFGLLMEILKDPKLGNYVRELVQARKPTFKRPYVETQEQRNLGADDRSLLRGAVQNAGFTGPQENAVFNMLMQNDTDLLAEEFRGGHVIFDSRNRPTRLRSTYIAQALATMIISVSPNLEFLAISQPFSTCLGLGTTRGRQQPQNIPDAYFPLDRLLRRLSVDPTTTPYLQNLRKVYMIVGDGDSDGRYYEESDFLECTTFFNNLSSIESISTDALYLGDDVRKKLEPGSSNISKIHINHSALEMPELVSVVQACKELREFQYSIGGRAVEEGWTASFNAKRFIKSICPHKDTLEVLDIDAESNMIQLHFYHFDEDQVDQEFDNDLMGGTAHLLNQGDDEHQLALSLQENIESLKDFHALKRLSLGIGFLIYFAMGVRKDGDLGPRESLILPESLPRSLE
ncbi:unnamed protein product [Penicillium manginii]